MFFGRCTDRRVATSNSVSSRITVCLLLTGLLVGCGETSSPLAEIYAGYEPSGDWSQPEATPVAWQPTADQETNDLPPLLELAAPMPVEESSSGEVFPAPHPPQAVQEPEVAQENSQNQHWSFPANQENNTNRDFSILVRLPPVEETTQASRKSSKQLIAHLLPPQPIAVAQVPSRQPPLAISDREFSPTPALAEIQTQTAPLVVAIAPAAKKSPVPVLTELSEQQRLLATLSRNSSSAVTGVLTDSRINDLAKKKIQHAYAMASRGALYVARQKLIEVLRMISQSKDAQQGTPERTKALAAGLRALREAEDFAPQGTQLEAELDITVLCASHRTPLAKQSKTTNLLPRLMMDRYFRYAQLQLAMSVAGEPAGSMALHALGKLNCQLGRVEPEKNRLADRHAIAYQQAALLAHNQNHLAAHELGVLLASSGHFAEAEQLLKQVAARESNAVVYRNLARVQEELGQPEQALASRDFARQLSHQGATGTNNVHWVPTEQFAQGSLRVPHYTTARRPATQQAQLVVPGSRPSTQRR